MKKDNLITFQTDDFTDQIKEVMVKNRHRAFPVVNKHGKYIGTVSRRNLLGMKKKEVILVDHNERSQAVDNIEAAEILEIIDHHRIGSIETMSPIVFRNQPVGCTATIMHQMYVERKSRSFSGNRRTFMRSDYFRYADVSFADLYTQR